MTNNISAHSDLSQAERIDQVCSAFEAAWKKGETPRLEDWLRDMPTTERLVLLQELLLVEIHYHSCRGMSVSGAEYRRRFPDLDESWLWSVISPAHETAADQGQATAGDVVVAQTPIMETIRSSSACELREEIGRGGMGVVYRGHDVELNRALAVKVLLEKHRDNKELQGRFLEEAQIMAQLQHPGVAPIHKIGRLADGRPFFSMKQIKGQTLKELLHAGQRTGDKSQSEALAPTELSRLLNIFAQICQTVAFAHSRGILHRDLKPANVMVGTFAEVQVMDWGLAKRISDRPPGMIDFQAAMPGLGRADRHTPVANPHSTAAGRILGTPAYMAPEQARGEVDQLDARCDVFGLGAILCELLTGEPAFPGNSQFESHRKAMSSDLKETFARLDGCPADPELVSLAKRCLAADRQHRPRDAGEVAAAVMAYQESVQLRLKRAELERTAAEARAGAEQKRRHAEEARARSERHRRRLTVALAAAVLLLVSGVAGAAIWNYQERADQALRDQEEDRRQTRLAAQRADLNKEIQAACEEAENRLRSLHHQLADPLAVAPLLSNQQPWQVTLQTADAAWNRGMKLADSSPDLLDAATVNRLDRIDRELKAAGKDYRLARLLDGIHLETETMADGKVQAAALAEPKYRKLLAGPTLTLEPGRGTPAAYAKRIREEPLRHILVAALDQWAFWGRDDKLRSWLLETARLADPDPWRDQLRDPANWQDLPKLQALALNVPKLQPPQALLLLAGQLRNQGDGQTAAVLLGQARLRYPQDFWLHFVLGNLSENRLIRVGCFQAALAIRPTNAGAYNNLGWALHDLGDVDDAIICYHKALDLDRDNATIHSNLGWSLYKKMELDAAIAEYKIAVRLDPTLALAHNNLGIALYDKGQLDSAIACFRKAVALNPQLVMAHTNLGVILSLKGDADGAIAAYEKAVTLEPSNAKAHGGLGQALLLQGRFAEARQHSAQALSLIPPKHSLHGVAQNQLAQCEQLLTLNQKLAAVLKGEVQPKNATEQLALAELCRKYTKQYAAAVRFYAAAFDANPNLVAIPEQGHRYAAVGAAVLAAAGQGKDADKLSAAEKSQLHRRALAWLTADMKDLKQQLQGNADQVSNAQAKLRYWQKDPDLGSVRDTSQLNRLPRTECQAWHAFWAEVVALTSAS